jgi:hypothetical protein
MTVSQLVRSLQVRESEGDGDLPVFIGGLSADGSSAKNEEVFFLDRGAAADGREGVVLGTTTNGKDPVVGAQRG